MAFPQKAYHAASAPRRSAQRLQNATPYPSAALIMRWATPTPQQRFLPYWALEDIALTPGLSAPHRLV